VVVEADDGAESVSWFRDWSATLTAFRIARELAAPDAFTPLALEGSRSSGRRSPPAGLPADITTFLGVGSHADTQSFCDAHPAYKHPFAIDGGNIQVVRN
jgi:hypothetical protein